MVLMPDNFARVGKKNTCKINNVLSFWLYAIAPQLNFICFIKEAKYH